MSSRQQHALHPTILCTLAPALANAGDPPRDGLAPRIDLDAAPTAPHPPGVPAQPQLAAVLGAAAGLPGWGWRRRRRPAGASATAPALLCPSQHPLPLPGCWVHSCTTPSPCVHTQPNPSLPDACPEDMASLQSQGVHGAPGAASRGHAGVATSQVRPARLACGSHCQTTPMFSFGGGSPLMAEHSAGGGHYLYCGIPPIHVGVAPAAHKAEQL